VLFRLTPQYAKTIQLQTLGAPKSSFESSVCGEASGNRLVWRKRGISIQNGASYEGIQTR